MGSRGRNAVQRVAGVLIVLVLGADLAVLATGTADGADRVLASAPPSTRPVTTTSRPPTTTTTTEPPATTTTTAPPPTTTTAVPSTTAPPPPSTDVAPAATGAWTLEAHRGLGAWVDVYDWTHEFGGPAPAVGPTQVEDMAANLGIQTLYIQTGHRRSAAAVIEPDRLRSIIGRAQAHGMQVVAWYLPTLEDLDRDLHRLLAAAALPVDGLGVDIEARDVADHHERNRRLLELSRRLRTELGGRAIAAITPSAVHLQVVNPGYWPDFPWAEVAEVYDAVLPMAYFSFRRGEYRSGERYIGENIDRIRASTGRGDVPVHPIGGIADGVTAADLDGMLRAATSRGAIGVSLYDYATSNPDQWRRLAPVRR